MLGLKHRAKCVGLDRLPRAAILGSGLSVPECEAYEETFAHCVIPVGHALESLLFVVDFLVLGHVCLAGEIIKVSRISFRVKFRDERGLGLSKRRPINLGKILVLLDIVNVGKALCSRVDTPAIMLDAHKLQ